MPAKQISPAEVNAKSRIQQGIYEAGWTPMPFWLTVLLTLQAQKFHMWEIFKKSKRVIKLVVSPAHDTWFYSWTPTAHTQCLCDDRLPGLPRTLINAMLDFTLDVLSLCKLRFCPEICSCFPHSKPVKSFVPHNCHLPLISVTFLFKWILPQVLLLLNFSVSNIHLLLLPLIILSVFLLGFSTTVSQEKVQRGAPASTLHPLIPHPCIFRRQDLRSHPCWSHWPVPASPHKAGKQQRNVPSPGWCWLVLDSSVPAGAASSFART